MLLVFLFLDYDKLVERDRKDIMNNIKHLSLWQWRFLSAMLCCYAAEYYFINPMIPKLVNDLGMAAATGWVTGAFFLGAILAIFLSSLILQKLGSWMVSWATVLTSAVVIIAFGWLAVDLTSLLVLQLVRGLLYGIQLAAADMMLTQKISAEQRPQAIGRMHSMSTLSLLLFSGVGIQLAEQNRYPAIWVIGAVLAVVSATLFACNRSPETGKAEQTETIKFRLPSAIYNRIIPCGIAVFGVMLFCGAIFQYIQKYTLENGLAGAALSFMVAMGVSVLFFRHIVLEKLRSYVFFVVLTSLVLLMLSGVLLSSGGVIAFYGAAVLVGAGFGVCVPQFAVWAYKDVPKAYRAQLVSLYTMCFNMGPFLGLVAGGLLGEGIGYRPMFLVLMPMLLVSIGMVLFPLRPKKSLA
jgi:MFS family permease